MTKNPVIDAMRLDGGILCLNFVNTVPDRVDGSDRDSLENFNDLIYWARKAEIINRDAFIELEKAGEANPKRTKDFFAESIHVRDLLYSIFRPISHKQKVKQSDLQSFNKLTNRYFGFLELVAQREKFVEKWNLPTDHFYNVMAPIIKSAYELLISNKLDRVKECPNCGWLFLDTTKNGKRKWCSMEDCGSNVKALEYYYRQKAKSN